MMNDREGNFSRRMKSRREEDEDEDEDEADASMMTESLILVCGFVDTSSLVR